MMLAMIGFPVQHGVKRSIESTSKHYCQGLSILRMLEMKVHDEMSMVAQASNDPPHQTFWLSRHIRLSRSLVRYALDLQLLHRPAKRS